MSNTTTTRVQDRVQYRLETFTLDWLTAALLGFLAIIQGGALLAVTYLTSLTIQLPEQSSSPEIGGWLIGIVVVESLLLVLVWRCYQWLSEYYQKLLRWAIVLSGFALVSALYLSMYPVLEYLQVLVLAGVAWASFKLVKASGLYWIVFNTMALVLGVAVTTLAGIALAPVTVLPLLVVAMVWDHYAVRLSTIMHTLVDFSTQTGITNYLIIPNQLRFDTAELKAFIQNEDAEKPPGLAAVIGLGDYIIPGMLITSLYTAGSPTLALTSLLGVATGTLVLRDSLEREHSTLPALLWLNTGAITGLVVGLLAYPHLLSIILGGGLA